MKAQLENISSIKQAINIEVPADIVDNAYKSAMEKVRKEAKVPGFRQGKIPEPIILQKFREELDVETIKAIARETYPKAVEETKAKPISDPQIEPSGGVAKGKPFSYKATFEIYPEVKVNDYVGLKLEREKVDVTDEEVELEVKRLQHQMTQLEPVAEGEVGPGHVAVIDFKGTAGGKPFAGSEAENYVVDFGGGQLLEEFEIKIKGMKVSEEREITFKYPENYFKKEVAGLEGLFKVKVKDLRRKIVPELNDEFAKELGKFGSMDEVKKDVKERIAGYKETISKNALKEQAIRQLIEQHKDIEVPTSFIDAELENMLSQLERQLKAQGQTLADSKIDAKEFVRANVKEATDRARGYMIVNAIAGEEKIQVEEGEVDARIKNIAENSRENVAKVREYYEKNNYISNLRSQILFEKTLDFVLGKAKISDAKSKKKK